VQLEVINPAWGVFAIEKYQVYKHQGYAEDEERKRVGTSPCRAMREKYAEPIHTRKRPSNTTSLPRPIVRCLPPYRVAT